MIRRGSALSLEKNVNEKKQCWNVSFIEPRAGEREKANAVETSAEH